MHSFSSYAASAFLLFSVCRSALALELRYVPRNLGNLLYQRDICYEDDTLLSFKYWIVDSEPYCSSLLGIVDQTSTLSRTSRTTRTIVSTTYATIYATATTPAVTIFSTSFLPIIAKRNGPQPTQGPDFYAENPYAYPVYAGDAAQSIASSYYSACSCLHLKPRTVGSIVTASTERTIRGIDYQTTTIYQATITSGTTTAILTRQAPSASRSSSTRTSPSSSPSSVIIASSRPLNSSTASLISTGPVSSSSRPSLTPSSTRYNASTSTVVTGPSSAISPSSTVATNSSITSLSPTRPFNSTSATSIIGSASSLRPVSSGVPSISLDSSSSARPTSGFPTISLNSSLTARPTSGFPTISLNLSSPVRPTSGFPTNSLNSSSSFLGSTGVRPSSSNITRSVAASTGFSIVTTSSNITSLVSGSLSSYSNISTSASARPTISLNTTTSSPRNTSTYSSSGPTITINRTTIASVSSTTTSPSTSPTLDLQHCPGINGTIITLNDGQQFAVVCNTEYGGPVDIGLNEDTFGGCVQDCGIANNGFSATRCRGITYFPNAPNGNNCFFKNLAGLSTQSENEDAISAVLINVPALNTTLPLPGPSSTPPPPLFTLSIA